MANISTVQTLINTEPVRAVLGRQVLLSFYEVDNKGDPELGLVLGSYTLFATANGTMVPSPATALGLSFAEVDSLGAPGEYQLAITPHVEGLLVVRLDRESRRLRWIVRVARRGLVDFIAAMEGGSARVKLTTQTSLAVPVPGTLIRVYQGDLLITQVVSNGSGEGFLDLAPGSYTVYLSKTGFDFSGYSPGTIVVPPVEEAVPIIDSLLPTSVGVATVVAVRGRFFHSTAGSNTLFMSDGVSTVSVAASEVDTVGQLLRAAVPAGLTPGPVTFWVEKPNPNAPPASLLSNAITGTLS